MLEYGKKLKYLKDKDPQDGMAMQALYGQRQRLVNKQELRDLKVKNVYSIRRKTELFIQVLLHDMTRMEADTKQAVQG